MLMLLSLALGTQVSASTVSILLTSSTNPSVLGRPLLLTATIIPGTTNGTTAGNITFYDGAAVLGIQPLVNGQAILTSSLLASGVHTLRAYSGGDATSGGISSAPLAETVMALPASGMETGVNYPAGAGALSVAEGDFNGDGVADLAIGFDSASNVAVFLGNGGGTFQPAVYYAAGTNPGPVAVSDFNGDGKTDIAVINSDIGGNGLSILLGNGDGTFQPAVGYAAGDSPFSIAIGDFNGDGKTDIAVADSADNGVSVLLGNGDGTFQTAVFYITDQAASFVGVGDFNSDGKADLVVANPYADDVSVLLGNGDGTFQPAANYQVGSCPMSIAIADFNLDGNLDLAVSNAEDNSVTVLFGNGDGTFAVAVTDYDDDFEAPTSIAVGDFNGDQIPDLIVANWFDYSVTMLIGNGDGTFQAGVSYAVGTNSEYVQTGDFNGDGRTDLAVANYGSGDVTILLGLTPAYSVPLLQTITFFGLGAVTLPASALSLTATASSGLVVSFVSTTLAVCTAAGSTVTIIAAGTCSITASQRGNATYAAAAPVIQSFPVNPATSSGGGGSGGAPPAAGNPLTVSPTSVTIKAKFGGAPGSQTVTLGYQTQTQGAPTFAINLTTNQGTGWLSVSPAAGTMTQSSYAGFIYAYAATVNISTDPTGVAGGSVYTGMVNFSSGGGLVSVPVTMNVSSQALPQPTGGIANAASANQSTPEVVGLGTYIAIYGKLLAGSGSPSAGAMPLPTTLNGTQVSLGGIPMPLLYASGGQINGLVPQGLTPNNSYPLVVTMGTVQSVAVTLLVKELQPGIYTLDTSGSGPGIVANALTGQLVNAANPAHASDYLVTYATGLGPVQGPNGEGEPADGAAAPGNLVYSTTASVTATIGGIDAVVVFSGLTPGLVGLYQANIQVPAGVAAGNSVPLVITATDPQTGATAQSNSVTIAVL
jgi:uncharacterized protein (TIGR03437 family)